MLTIAQAFDMAVQHHQAGRLGNADQLYRQILQVDPHHVGSLHFLGLLVFQLGQSDLAIEHISQALRLQPELAEAHCNLGMVHAQRGSFAEAVACLRQALRLKPDQAEAHNNLGNVLRKQGNAAEAEASYRQALRLRPDYAQTHYNLGLVLAQQERLPEAVDCYRHALMLKPEYAEALTDLGKALADLGKLAEAVDCYHQALRLKPDSAEANNNLGVVLAYQNRPAEAAACYQEAVRKRPDYADAHVNLAHVMLLRGDFEHGWSEYEWRWRCKEFLPPSCPQPSWNGSCIQGRTILLLAEQGLGDTLQFVRYAPLVQQQGARVMVQCRAPVVRLLQTCTGIDRLVPTGTAPPPFDVQASLLSLPGIMGTTLRTIPARVPYLFADPDLRAGWKEQLRAASGFRVGIVWQGNPEHKRDQERSVPFRAFAPLADVPGVRLVGLQKGHGREQLPALASRLGVLDVAEQFEDLADTAAAIVNLDLVITVDTAVGHLAGALGVPVWLALPLVADWRWLEDRQESPWYPSIRPVSPD